jgi:RHS repeat-associated protein
MGNKSGTSAQIISLPKGGGALSGIGETFSPDLFTGTGNFTVPIALPPGRNGFQPQLNLVYSTGSGNGPFGLGWSLSVPGVSRKTSKGVPTYQDAEDVFILSGAEDLIPVAGDFPGDVRYRPRTEGLFAHITFRRSKNCWEVKSKDGLVSHYGDDPDAPIQNPAVIADPKANDGDKVFAWNLVRTRDTFGNRIDYEYKRDRIKTKERHWDQLYLRQIRYVEFKDASPDDRFLISVTLNYEPSNEPEPRDEADEEDVIATPPERGDAFSDYRAGFEIRTRKRCKSIVVETHAEKDRRVRTYELIYLDERVTRGEVEANLLPLNGVSLLSQIRVIGHDDEQPLKENQTQELPPLEFGYARFEPEKRKYVPLRGQSLPPRSLGSPDIDLADLFGNGLPDVFEMNGVVRYWRNRGDTTFDIPREMPDAPAGVSLADPGVQLLDANGDGRVDLMVTTPQLSGFFSTRPEGLWDRRSFQRYQFAPSVNLEDPEVQLIDMDGDGVTDAIRSGTRFEVFFNDPREGWNQTKVIDRRDAEEFPNVNFSDPRVRWADLSGDGLQNIVLIHNGNVEYWPHFGYGNFGKRIRMANSPRFEDAAFFPSIGYDPKRVLVGDVDGDGRDDIVYIGAGHITLWINQSGNGWSDPITIHGTPLFSNIDAVRLVDMLGNGTAGILWSYDFNAQQDSTLKFLDLTGGTKPYVLNKMDNHMGALTLVEYAPSTRFYLADDKDPKTRWKTKLPFPVQVVSRVEVVDAFSRGKLTTEYRYHHGYWDGGEREFRGFGRVDQFDTETFDNYHRNGLHSEKSFDPVGRDVFSPPTETRTWFHLGPIGEEFGEWGPEEFSHSELRDEFFAEDPSVLPELQAELSLSSKEIEMLKDLPRRVKRDGIRALRGRVIRTELYARDGTDREKRPFTVTETLHGVCGVLDNGDESKLLSDAESLPEEWKDDAEAHRVFFPHVIAARTTQWERGNDPMTRFSFTEDYDEFGQPQKETQIACPRGWRTLDDAPSEPYLATQSLTLFAAPPDGADAYIRDRVAKATTFDVVRLPGEENAALPPLLQFKQEADDGVRVKVISQIINFYDGEAFVGLANGEVGEHGAVVRSESLVLTEEILREAYADAVTDSPEIPPYLNPDGPPAWTPEYPQEFRDNIEALPGLAGFTFHARDEIHERGYFASSARNKFDFQESGGSNAKGLLLTVRDAVGDDPLPGEHGNRDTDIGYDEFDLLPVEVTDPAKLTIVAKYDGRVMQPHLITDPNGNESEFTFTPLGLLREIFVRGKTSTEGDQARPSTRFEYDFMAFEKSPPDEPRPISVRTIQHEHHDTEVDVALPERDATIESVEFTDGFGRLLQARGQGEDVLFGDGHLDAPLFGNNVLPANQADNAGTRAPVIGRERDATDPPNVVVNGWQIYDNKGRIVEKFEPFFDQGFEYLSLSEAKERRPELFGQKITMFYDPLGRVVRTLNPDGSEQRVVFGVPRSIDAPDVNSSDVFEPTPWIAFTYDANDLAPLSKDPVTKQPLTHRAPQHHHFTPSNIIVDALGRTIVAIERNRDAPEGPDDPSLPSFQEFVTRSAYDIRGNLLTVTDALDRKAFEYIYDLANNALRVKNVDAGIRRTILDAVGNEIEHRDKKGALILQSYDVLHRPTRLWARDAKGEEVTLRERLIYGDGSDSGLSEAEVRPANLLRSLFRHYDEAGLLEFEEYDFKGNVLHKNRRMIRDDAILQVSPAFRVNWDPFEEQETALLDEKRYETSATYDAMNRVKTLRYPRDVKQQRNKVLKPRYNGAGALEGIVVDDNGKPNVFVDHIAYDAKGQRTLITLGNGVIARYAYDPQTFRLVRLRSEHYRQPVPTEPTYEPSGKVFQDFGYEYDLVGNIRVIHDRTPESGIPGSVLGVDALDRGFEYDAIYRLTFATGRECDQPAEMPFDPFPRCTDLTKTRKYNERYHYDRLGNMEELSHTIFTNQINTNGFVREFKHRPGTNQLENMTFGQTKFNYVYDPNGNISEENTERHFEWDHSDRMKVFRNQPLAAEATVDAHYLYDSAGTRVKKLVNKGGQVEVTEYVDGLFEFQRASGIENNTLHIMDDQRRIAMIRVGEPLPKDTAPAIKYHLGDHLGSSSAVVDKDGTLINREEYTPYGESSFGSLARKRYRFTGKERDEESGLYYHGARYYAPWLARWPAPDPAGAIEGPNLYSYALSNPMSRVDALGLQSTNTESLSSLQHYPATQDMSQDEIANFLSQMDQLHPEWREERNAIWIHGTAGPDPGPDPAAIDLKLSGLLIHNKLTQAEGDWLWRNRPEMMTAWSAASRAVNRITADVHERAVLARLQRIMFKCIEIGAVYDGLVLSFLMAPYMAGDVIAVGAEGGGAGVVSSGGGAGIVASGGGAAASLGAAATRMSAGPGGSGVGSPAGISRWFSKPPPRLAPPGDPGLTAAQAALPRLASNKGAVGNAFHKARGANPHGADQATTHTVTELVSSTSRASGPTTSLLRTKTLQGSGYAQRLPAHGLGERVAVHTEVLMVRTGEYYSGAIEWLARALARGGR